MWVNEYKNNMQSATVFNRLYTSALQRYAGWEELPPPVGLRHSVLKTTQSYVVLQNASERQPVNTKDTGL